MVEHNLAKVGVAGSSPVSRSRRDGRVVTKDGKAVGRQRWFFIGGIKPPLMLPERRQRGFIDPFDIFGRLKQKRRGVEQTRKQS